MQLEVPNYNHESQSLIHVTELQWLCVPNDDIIVILPILQACIVPNC